MLRNYEYSYFLEKLGQSDFKCFAFIHNLNQVNGEPRNKERKRERERRGEERGRKGERERERKKEGAREEGRNIYQSPNMNIFTWRLNIASLNSQILTFL